MPIDRTAEKRVWNAITSVITHTSWSAVSPQLNDAEVAFLETEILPKLAKGYRYIRRASVLAAATPEEQQGRAFQDGALWAMEQLKGVVAARRDALGKLRAGLPPDLSSVISALSGTLEGLWIDASQAITTKVLPTIRARKAASPTPR